MAEARAAAGRPALTLVAQWLEALGVPFAPERLQEAAVPDEGASCDWLRAVLAEAHVRDVSPIEVPWQRFDPRRLPALVAHEGTWHLAERDAVANSVRLTPNDGEPRSLTADELDGAPVLWLKLPPRPAQAAEEAQDEPPVWSGNLATALVWQELFRERGWLWQIVVATCLVNVLGVAASLFAMQVYDRVVPTMAYATLTALAAGMVIVVLLDWALKSLRARILDSLASAVDQRVSEQVFQHLLHLQLDAQPRSLGTLAAQVGSLDAVRQFFSATVVFALVDLPFVLMFLFFIALIGGVVAGVYGLLLPAALLLGLFTQWRLKRLFKSQLNRINERQGLLVDTIRGAESIRASNASWRFAAEWQALTASINRYGVQQRAYSSLSAVTTSSLSIMAYVGGIVVGVWQIEAGLLTMGGLIACTVLGGRVIAPVAQSVQHLVQWQQVRQALAMVHGVLSLTSERRPDQELLTPTAPGQALSLESVRFGYAGSPVRQLSVDRLHLTAGDRVLLVGPVGSGKSTLLKLLAGLYRPSEGRVRLGQADLWETDPLLVAGQIGYLPQTVHLFRGTLRSNLSLTGTASDDRLLTVSQQLGIDGIAEGNPLGMDLPISEGGEGLSGGQRQLVALARVFVNQPRIWLLDEPAASLDREMEERVWRALEAVLRPDDLLVVSTHRPLMASGVVNRVLVMQQGTIVRDGPPETVLPRLTRRSTPTEPAAGRGSTDAL